MVKWIKNQLDNYFSGHCTSVTIFLNTFLLFHSFRLELEVIGEMRKPIEDMSLDDHKDLPELKRIEGLRLSGEAFANILMTYEFLHNFGETLGFEMDSLPTMDSLQVTN